MKYSGRESATLEFKASVPKNDQIIKTIIAFCNQKGGKLVLGVENNGTIVGLPDDDVTQLMETMEAAIYRASSPPIIPLISARQVGEKTIVVIEVSAGMNPPYFRTSEGVEQGTYVRLGRSTLRAGTDMIEELRLHARGRHFDELIMHHSSLDDLDQERVTAFLKVRKVKSRHLFSEEVCRSYSLVAVEHSQLYVTVAGLLLFGREPDRFFPEAFTICTHYRGTSGRDVLATRDCKGPLFDQFHDAFDWVLSRLNRSFTIEGARRTEQLEIPSEAIREIILNALIHRNYRIPGPNKIAIYDDRLEIFSPGPFPGPLHVNESTLGTTYVRNYAISKVFREAQYVEKLGSGFLTLFESYRAYGLKTPEVIEGPNFVKCILPREKQLQKQTDPLTNQILRLLEAATAIKVRDVVEVCNVSRSTAKRKLDQMIEQGLIVRRGEGRAIHYTTS